MNLQLRDHGNSLALTNAIPSPDGGDCYGYLFQNIPREARDVIEYLLELLDDAVAEVGSTYDHAAGLLATSDRLIADTARTIVEKGYSEDEFDALVDYAASLSADSDDSLEDE